MAASTISTAFVAEYEADVKLAYQRQGSLLRNTVRRKTGVVGSTAIFQWYGKGIATDKSRNSDVVPMNPYHVTATATLVDKYAPIYVDSLDELKLNIDERGSAVKASAWALGRVADQQIIDVLDGCSNDAAASGDGATLAKMLSAIDVKLRGGDVAPGNITVTIGWYQVAELMQIDDFTGYEHVGTEYPLLKAAGAFTWHGAMFIPHSGLTKTGSTRYCYAYDEQAIGHAIGQEIKTEINYVPTKVSWLINAYMSQGAVLIDNEGVSQIECKES